MKPRLQIIVDAEGAPVLAAHLRWMKTVVAAVFGSDVAERGFWVTRSDLYHDLIARGVESHREAWAYEMIHDRYHEQTFDFYQPGETIPTGRIVNVKKVVRQ